MSCKELDISYDARFSCQGCTACCRNRQIPISPLELQALEGFDWVSAAPQLAGKPLFSRAPTAEGPLALALARVGGACVFLAEDGRCLVWARPGGWSTSAAPTTARGSTRTHTRTIATSASARRRSRTCSRTRPNRSR